MSCWQIGALHDHSLARIKQPPPAGPHPAIISARVLEALPTLAVPAGDAPSFLSQFAPAALPSLPEALAAQREALLSSLASVTALVEATRGREAQLPEGSRLPWTALVVDCERREAMVAEGEREVAKRVEAIEREHWGAELVCERIRRECWDGMQVKGQVVKGLKEEEEGVRNFPLRQRTDAEVRRTRQLQLLREMELAERRWRWMERERREKAEGDRELHSSHSSQPGFDAHPQASDVSHWSHEYCEGVDYVQHSEDAQHPNLALPDEAAFPQVSPPVTGAVRADSAGPRGKEAGKKEAVKGAVAMVTIPLAFDANHSTLTFTIPSFYLYHPLDVITASRQRVQALLLLEKAIHVKMAFNAAFQDFYQQKQKDLATLSEKSKRLAEIAQELGMEAVIPRYELSDEEVADSVLTVSDREMTHSRGDPHANTGPVSDARALEAQSALMEMMNGSVESRRDLSLLEAELTPAEWMKGSVEDMSEEEKAELARFEKKVKMIEGERESRRKMLQGEFNKGRSDCADIGRAFDFKVRLMRDQRLRAQRDVLHIDWYRQRLRIAQERQTAARREQREAEQRRSHYDALLAHLHTRMDAFRGEVEAAQAGYEAVGAEVKALERTLRKEVTEAGENYDHLCKLYRVKRMKASSLQAAHHHGRRSSVVGGVAAGGPRHRSRASAMSIAAVSMHGPRASLFGIEGLTGAGLNLQGKPNRRRSVAADEKQGGVHGGEEEEGAGATLNPYGEVAVTAAGGLEGEESLPPFAACDLDAPPPDLNASLWCKFVERRRVVVDKEAEVKARLAALQDSHRFYMRLQTVEDHLQAAIGEAQRQLTTAAAALHSGSHPEWDATVVVRIQQGLVEMSDTDVVQVTDDVELRGRAAVEELNGRILVRGQAKLALLQSMHEYEAERRLLEWQHSMLQLQHEQALDVTTQLQLLRVTKRMQQQLKEREEGRSDQLSDDLHSVTQAMERKMEHIRAATRQLNHDKQLELNALHRRTRRITRENGELRRRVELLKEAVQQRTAIDELRDEGARERAEEDRRKMRGVVARRRLVDLAALQREEIAWLRGQVEGLRRKTFASFVDARDSRRAEEEKQMIAHGEAGQTKARKQKQKQLILPAI